MPRFTKDTHTNLSSQVILWISWYHDIQVSSHTRPHSRDKAVNSCALKLGLMQTSYAASLPVILCSITYLSAKGKRGKTSLKSPHSEVKVKSLSRIRLFATPWTVACQALLSMGFPRQKYWSGLPVPSPGDLPDPGIEPESPALVGGFFTIWVTKEAHKLCGI